MSRAARRVTALALWLLAGCFPIQFPDGVVACGDDLACPEGFGCGGDGLCWRNPDAHVAMSDGGDGGTDGPTDASISDSAVDAMEPDLAMCGQTGQPCCAGATACLAGCCVGNACVAVSSACGTQSTCVGINACASTCGGPYQAPCPGLVCTAGACLDAGNTRCLPSGVRGSTAGTVCAGGSFVSCGAAGQPCCAADTGAVCAGAGACCLGNRCVDAGTSCGVGNGMCMNGSCGGCGGATKKCCAAAGAEADVCTASLVCGGAMNDDCVGCGGPGQPCCAGGLCGADGCCDRSTNTCIAEGGNCGGSAGTCDDRGCSAGTCGRLGQAACPGNVSCTEPFTKEVGGGCVACGGLGGPCCTGINGGYCAAPYACQTSGVCAPCGGPGQPCCAGRFCTNGASCSSGTCS